MKKIVSSIAAALMCLCAYAQKPVVVVDYFTSPSCTDAGVSGLTCKTLCLRLNNEEVSL